jgi:hypothetical protein
MLYMVFTLMSKEINILNIGHNVMNLTSMSNRVCDVGIGIDAKR